MKSNTKVRDCSNMRGAMQWTLHGWLRLLIACVIMQAATYVAASDADVTQAEALVTKGSYQQAYDLLTPLAGARGGDARFDYLLGRAALGTNRPEEARRLLERSIAKNPDTTAAHLALGRAYFALGMYAEARIEFETVLRLDNLPPDLESQAAVYNEAAREVLDEGRRLVATGFALGGVGRYRVNSTRGTDAFGGGDRRDTFYNAGAGGALSYVLDNGYSLNGRARYDFRWFDNEDIRNDSDLRWRAGASRNLGEGNVAFGVNGRVSYRGDSQYRNDYGLFADYRYRLDEDNQLGVGAILQRRRYPTGPLRERSRTLADLSLSWVRALFHGKGSFTLKGHGGYQYATSRDDGDAAVFGAMATLDYTFSETLGGFVFGLWERNNFNTDALHFHPDALDEGVVLRRSDNLYEVGVGLVWEFARGWTLRPELLYIRDQSNSVGFNYSATETWINVRKDF
jgi:tetratricopeptide (TPR) repeat protein